MTERILEFFAGIGGYRCAWPEAISVGAIEIDRDAASVYRSNWGSEVLVREIASLREEEAILRAADVWLMSPPCQPFSVRGHRNGLDDPRSAALRNIVRLVQVVRPRSVVLENVPGFQSSAAGDLWRETLTRGGYHFAEYVACPTEFGLPNRRSRFYCVASHDPPADTRPMPKLGKTIADLLMDVTPDESILAELQLAQDTVEKFGSALDRVSLEDPYAITACFGSSYGRSLMHAGSYVVTGEAGLRRFSPLEVLRLLGFPASFRVPDELTMRSAWRLAGNSLSLPVVRWVLSHLPGGPDPTWPPAAPGD